MRKHLTKLLGLCVCLCIGFALGSNQGLAAVAMGMPSFNTAAKAYTVTLRLGDVIKCPEGETCVIRQEHDSVMYAFQVGEERFGLKFPGDGSIEYAFEVIGKSLPDWDSVQTAGGATVTEYLVGEGYGPGNYSWDNALNDKQKDGVARRLPEGFEFVVTYWAPEQFVEPILVHLRNYEHAMLKAQEELAVARNANGQTSDKLVVARRERDAARAELEAARRKIAEMAAAMQAAGVDLSEGLGVQTERLDDLLSRIEELQSELDEARRTINQQEWEIGRLENDLENVTADLAAAEEAAAGLRGKVAGLEAAVGEREELRGELKKVKAQLAEAVAQKSKLTERLDKLEEELSKRPPAPAKTTETGDEETGQKEPEYMFLLGGASFAYGFWDANVVPGWLARTLFVLIPLTLLGLAGYLGSTLTPALLRDQVMRLEDERDELERRLDEANRLKEAQKTRRREQRDLKEAAETTKASAEAAKIAAEDARDTAVGEKRAAETAQAEAEARLAARAGDAEAIRRLEEDARAAQRELDGKVRKITELEDRVRSIAQQLANKEAELSDKVAENSELASAKGDLERRVDGLTAEMEALEPEVTSLREQVTDLTVQLAAATSGARPVQARKPRKWEVGDRYQLERGRLRSFELADDFELVLTVVGTEPGDKDEPIVRLPFTDEHGNDIEKPDGPSILTDLIRAMLESEEGRAKLRAHGILGLKS